MTTYNKPTETDKRRVRRYTVQFWSIVAATLAGIIMYMFGLTK